VGVERKDLHSKIQDAVKTILSKANSRYLDDDVHYSNANVIIGEYGFNQVEMSGQEAAARIKILFRAAETAGVSYAIFWQILNNRETGSPTCLPTQRTNFGLISVIRGYWMYWNSAGKAFIHAMAGR